MRKGVGVLRELEPGAAALNQNTVPRILVLCSSQMHARTMRHRCCPERGRLERFGALWFDDLV